MSIAAPELPEKTSRRTVHRAWWVAAVSFVALVGAAAFRATPSVFIEPLHDEFGWSHGTISAAISVNILLYGLFSPFASALQERYGIRRVVSIALGLIALGGGATVFMTESWQLVLCWGFIVGIGTGSMAMAFVATITNRWFIARRGLVSGILTAGGAAGQLVFLPLVGLLVEGPGWRAASLLVAATALAMVPLVLLVVRDRPEDVGLKPFGADADYTTPAPSTQGAAKRPSAACGRPAAPARSGSSRARSRSVARPRTASSAPTSCPPPTTTGCP
nr:hypothetical protein GCM10025732_35130 [Glycomyces mayteni]